VLLQQYPAHPKTVTGKIFLTPLQMSVRYSSMAILYLVVFILLAASLSLTSVFRLLFTALAFRFFTTQKSHRTWPMIATPFIVFITHDVLNVANCFAPPQFVLSGLLYPIIIALSLPTRRLMIWPPVCLSMSLGCFQFSTTSILAKRLFVRMSLIGPLATLVLALPIISSRLLMIRVAYVMGMQTSSALPTVAPVKVAV
jgi:hypothetical protein